MKFRSSLVSLALMSFVVASGQQVSSVKQTVKTIAKGKTVSVTTRQVRVVKAPVPAKLKVLTLSSSRRLSTTGEFAGSVGTKIPVVSLPVGKLPIGKKVHPDLFPGYPNATISSQNFPTTAVGQTSAPITVTFPFPPGGNYQELSFAGNSNAFAGQATCSSTACSAPIYFEPNYPGLTKDAILSKDANGNVLYETLIYGTGTAPQFGYDLGGTTIHNSVTSQPGSIAVGPDGSIYLTDASEDAVIEIAPDFSSQSQLSITGLGSTGGVAVDGAGTIYVADKTNNVIVSYNPQGGQATISTSTLSNPSGLAVNGAGLLFIADTGNGRIIAIDNQGGETTVASGLSSPTSLAVDAAGDLFYADSGNGGEITEIPVENNPISIATQQGTLYDMAVDAAGRLYISTPGGDTLISPDGTIQEYGGGPNYGMALDQAGDVLFSQPAQGSLLSTNRSVSNFILSTEVDTTTSGGDTISNTGNAALMLSNIAITGGTVFTDDDSDQCFAGLTMQPAQRCDTLVDFAPTAAQSYTESYTVTSNSLYVTTTTDVDTLYGNGIGVPTSTALSISPSPATTGQGITFTANVNQQGETELPAPTGTVSFLDGTTVLGSGTLSENTAMYSTANLAGGTHSITAMYTGDNNNAPSASPAQSLLVTAGVASTTALSSTPNSPRVGQAVTFAITVSGTPGVPVPTGTVTLMNNAVEPSPVLGTVTIDGNGNGSFSTINLAAGSYSVVATYNGDANYSPSSSGVDRFTVSPPIATNTTLTASPATVAYESPVTLTASVAVDDYLTSGQVIFCSTTASFCNATLNLGTAQVTSSGSAVLTLGSGTIGSHSYTAMFLGGNGYGASTSTAQTVTVTGDYPTTTAISATPLGATATSAGYVLTATVVGFGTNAAQPRGGISFIDTSDPNASPTQGELGFATFGFALAQPANSPIAVGEEPYGVATGDFNGDGFQDVVVENYESGTVSVLLGNGNGTFQPQVTYSVGTKPERVLVADLNGDGFLDLIVANTGSNTISVLLGNGDGTFKTQVTYQCASPVGLGVMDINHDGFPDVVAGDYYTNTMSVLLGNGDGTLKAAVTYATGSTPQTVAEGDFNGDGNIDVAVGNEGGATVGIFLGNGDGTFQTMVTYAVGNLPMGVQVGDFNSDGKQDLAVTNQGDGTVSVLLGNGDGTFQTQTTYPVGVQPVGLAIADFNGDGIEDITVGNTGQASLTQGVLLGNGDGTFQPQVTFPTGNFPYGVAVADFNGDGLPDLAIADYVDGKALILLSQVTATATGDNSLTVGGGPNDIHNVEAMFPEGFNFAASTSPTIALPGGVATLAASVTALTSTPAAPTVGQSVTFSVAVTGATPVATGTVTLMNTAVTPATVLGTITLGSAGTGTFSTATLAAGTYSVVAAYSGDANYAASTSNADMFTVAPAPAAVATTTALSTSVTTVAYETRVTLSAKVTASNDSTVLVGQVIFCDTAATRCTPAQNVGLAQLTANNNGAAVLKLAPGTIGTHSYKAVFLGTASYATSTSATQAVAVTGTYPTVTTIAATGSAGSYSLTGTVVGIGAISPGETGSVSFIDASNANAVLGTAVLGTGVAGFNELQATGSPFASGSDYGETATGDFNGDGFLDVVVVNQNDGPSILGVLLGNGDGTFKPEVDYTVGYDSQSVQIADVNGDGILDLVVANLSDDTVGVLLGNGDGTFQTQVTYQAAAPVGLAVMDLNHDGLPDIVVGNSAFTGGGTVSVLLNNGDGTFQPAVSYVTGGATGSLAEGDFNGDGNIDLAVATGLEGGGTVAILLGNGDGTFQPQVTYTVPGQSNAIKVGDFNGDGILDLAVADPTEGQDEQGGVDVLLGKGDGTFNASVTYPAGNEPITLVVGDFNGDGVQDIAVLDEVGVDNSENGAQSIILGNGDGTFQAAVTVSPGAIGTGIAAGDFNGDGHPDLAVPVPGNDDSGLAILLSHVTLKETTLATSVTIGGGADSTHNVEASYPGDTTYGASVSQPTTLIGSVVQVASTTTLGITPAAPTVGQSVTFSVSVTGATPVATGTVTLKNTAVSPAALLGTITLGTTGAGSFSTTTLAAGTYTVVASYSGDTNYLASMSAASALVVGKDAQTITFGALGNQTYGAGPIALTATASSELPVSYSATGPATVNGTTLTVTGVGTVTVTASQTGNATYAAATAVSQSFTVAKAVLTATANNASREFGSANPVFTYSAIGFVNGDTAAVVGGTATLASTATATSNAGMYPITFATKALTATNYTFNYVGGTLTVLGGVAQTIAFPAIPNHVLGDAPFTLSATASSGLAVSYTVTAGPATVAGSTVTLTGGGTVTIQATQAGNADYAAATPVSQTFTVSAVPAPTASGISPAGVVAGSGATTITLTGTNFAATDTVEFNGATEGSTLPTTFVNATTLTAVIPANLLTDAQAFQVSVVDGATKEASAVVNFVVAVAPVVVFTGPSTAASDQQPMVTFQLKQPYATPINCLLTLTFAPATSTGIDDPAVQFSTGGRTISFTVPAGSTTTPAVQFQTGTVAGTVTVTLGIVADEVNVTPANVAPIVVVLPEIVPQVATATLSRTGAGTSSAVTITMTGFSNTREVKSAIFHFTPTPGNTLAESDVTIDVSGIFATWFSDEASDAYGSSFTYTQPFNLSADPATIQSVTATLVNGVGSSVAQTSE